MKTNDDDGHVYTTLFTGSGFTINPYAYSSYYKEEDYVCNITNLKNHIEAMKLQHLEFILEIKMAAKYLHSSKIMLQ